jgi:sulfur carrier protein
VRITANGRGFDLDGPMSVSEFVRARGLDPRHVVVERNGEPLERARYEETILAERDRLELVRAVAGGSGGVARHDCSSMDITLRADPQEKWHEG